MGGNMVVSPGEPTILASVGQFPLLREFRERSPRPSNAEHTAELLALAARAAWVRGDAAALTRAGRRLFRLAGAGALARDVLALGDLAASRLGPPPAGMTLPWASDPALSLPPRLVPELLGDDFATYRSCAALLERLYSSDPEAAPPDGWSVQDSRRVLGRALPATLGQLTSSAVALGRWSTATDHAAEGLAMARIGGQAMEAAGMLAQLAWIAAARGQAAECDRLAAEALAITAPRGFALVTATVTWALGLLDLSLGHPARALDRLAPLASSSGSTPVLLLATADLVEAAVRAGRPAAAEPLLAQLDRWVELVGPAWALATTFHAARCWTPARRRRSASRPRWTPAAAARCARSRTPAHSSTTAPGCGGSGAGARRGPGCGQPSRPSSGSAPRPGPSGRAWSCWPAEHPRPGRRAFGQGRTTVVPAPIGGVASGRRRGDAR